MDEFYGIAKVALPSVRVRSGFAALCAMLSAELDGLTGYMTELFNSYQKRLPVESDELRDVSLGDEIHRLTQLASDLNGHSLATEQSIKQLKVSIDTACRTMTDIDDWLFRLLETESVLLSKYGKEMLDVYTERHWRTDRQKALRNQPDTDYGNKIAVTINSLERSIRKTSARLLDDKGRVVSCEALGHYLWKHGCRPADGSADESILFRIKMYEYYIERNLTFALQYRETLTNRISNEDRIKKEAESKIQEIKVRILDNCREYFISDEWIGTIGKILDEMLEDNDCCNILNDKGLNKIVHVVAGVLKNRNIFYARCTCRNVVESIGLCETDSKSPTIESGMRYMRRLEEEVILVNWLNAKITHFHTPHQYNKNSLVS